MPRPPNPALPASGDWPVLALLGARPRRARRLDRRAPPARAAARRSEPTSGSRARPSRCSALGVVALLVLATNPFALLFFLPALHAWLWLPQVRARQPAARALILFCLGLIGPLLIVLSLALRFGLGFDAPWYLLELVAVGYVHVPAARDRARRRGVRGAARSGRGRPLRAVSAGRRAAGPRAAALAHPRSSSSPSAPAGASRARRGSVPRRSDLQVADRRACGELALAARHEHERVGGGGADDHVRVLAADAGRARSPSAARAHQLVAVRVALHRAARAGRAA